MIIATAVAATALAASPAAGLSTTQPWQDITWGGNWDPEKVGDPWDGGDAEHDDIVYGWPEMTYDYQDDVCPGTDEEKTDTDDDPTTLTLTAPAGKLISAYCIKSGSGTYGEGAKIVVLEEPVAELVLAYPTDGKCKAISHYTLAYVDAPAETVSTPDEPTEPSEPTDPGDPVVDDEPEKPSPDDTEPDVVIEEDEVEDTPPATTSDDETPETLQDDATDEEITASAGDDPADGGEPLEEAGGAQTLALTGGEVTTLGIAAVVLVAVGVTAIMLGRRRTA